MLTGAKRSRKGDEQDQEGGEEEWDAREAAGGSDESALVFSSDANEEKIREGLKRRQEQREAELDSVSLCGCVCVCLVRAGLSGMCVCARMRVSA